MSRRVPEAALDALRTLLGERASTAPADLEAASHDASSQPPHHPDVVVWPLTTAEVAAIVEIAVAHRTPLTPRAGGSSLEGNPIPTAGGIVLDCSRMAEVTAIRPADLQVDVQPGVVYAHVNTALRPHGLFFPPSPGGSADWATVGGMVANNASGIYSVKYGGTRDHVRAATVVTGTGEVVRLGNRCRKSASGYHLLGLMVGSEGTLGIITELTLALDGLPAARRRGGFVFPDAGAAARVVADLVRYGVDVAAVEFLDAPTLAALNRFRAFGLVERPSLLLEVHGSDATVDEVWTTASEVAVAAGGTALDLPDPWAIRELATRAVEAERPDAGTVRADLAIPIGALPELVRACEETATARALPMHVFGHAGIGILHVLVPADASERAAAEAARDALVERVLALGGSCSGEHGMGTGNRRFAALEHGAALALMRGVKAVFDPHGILNPGKIW
ncbi:MAG TPA: FAD-binding oxidoreductase [Candidatus Binatia bacterium]|jgi:D-lactate dehydrogenase (cytochrome)|nr:FAD-binding oxidoreductase [Candidatus Binatia bacterium]